MSGKKKKRKKSIGLWIGAALFLAAVVMALGLRIRDVSVEGNKKYSAEQVEALLFEGGWDRNSLVFYLTDRFRPHKQIPFVEDYEITFNGPFSVEVIIYEKSVVGYVSYMSSYMYFDKDGIIVESSSSRLEGVPWVTGLTFGQIVLNKPLPVEDEQIFGQIMNLTQDLAINEISADQIRYDSYKNVTLTIGDVEVYLGDHKEMNGKIAELHDILPELAGMAGTLYLDTYNELSSGMWYSFIKR